jgi:hypothetical protein
LATIVVTHTARDDLRSLIRSHSLPRDTPERVRRSLEPLATHPRLGSPLGGRWARLRFILGPWRWFLIVYTYDESNDTVVVVTMQDARSASSPSSER